MENKGYEMATYRNEHAAGAAGGHADEGHPRRASYMVSEPDASEPASRRKSSQTPAPIVSKDEATSTLVETVKLTTLEQARARSRACPRLATLEGKSEAPIGAHSTRHSTCVRSHRSTSRIGAHKARAARGIPLYSCARSLLARDGR